MSETAEKVIETAEKAEDTAAKAEKTAVSAEEDTKKKGGKLAAFEKKMERTPFLLTIWQLIKFSLISITVSLVQIILQYILPLIFDRVTAVLPSWLAWIFNANSLFDGSPADYAKYVVAGVVTWGYVLPFFLSNYIANVYGYIMNKKKTFKSNAPRWHFVIYFIILTAAIVFSTWLQGFTYGWINHIDSEFIHAISRLLVTIPAGLFQFVVVFIAEKLLLPPIDKPEKKKKDKKVKESAAAAVETAGTADPETAEVIEEAVEDPYEI